MPHTLDTRLSLAMVYERTFPCIQLFAFSADFARAYKPGPLLRRQGDAPAAILVPPGGIPAMSQLRTHPFGSRRSPANGGRAAAFVRFALDRLFGILLSTYVDDCFKLEPQASVGPAYRAVNECAMLLGSGIDGPKAQSPRTDIGLVGASVSFRVGKVEDPHPKAKREEIANDMKLILAIGTIGPAEASGYRAKLVFFQTSMCGRAGRALLQPFTERQYASMATTRSKLSPPLRGVIPWWVAMIDSPVCRHVCNEYRMPAVVYTDASGAGPLGAVGILDGRRRSAHTHCPGWFLRANSGILEIDPSEIQRIDTSMPTSARPASSTAMCQPGRRCRGGPWVLSDGDGEVSSFRLLGRGSMAPPRGLGRRRRLEAEHRGRPIEGFPAGASGIALYEFWYVVTHSRLVHSRREG